MTFDEFYTAHKTLVYRLCRSRASHDLAEESTARAFVEVWKHWDRISTMKSPIAYTVRIAKNIIYHEYIKSKTRKILHLETIEEILGNSSPETDSIESETIQEFWQSMHQLSHREQEIIILKDLENHSFQECASILGLSLTATKSLRHRARTKLAVSLEKILGEYYG